MYGGARRRYGGAGRNSQIKNIQKLGLSPVHTENGRT